MSKMILAWYLVVSVCAAPEYQECKLLQVYEQRSGLQCEFNRLLADHIWQKNIDMVYAVVFSRCESIDNTPKPLGKRRREH